MMTATGADVTRVTEDYLALIWKACEWPDDGRRPNTTDLAAALGVPAVPIAHNAGQFWPKRGLMHPGTVHVVVGEPIDPHGKTPAEINAIAETWINDTRARLVAAEKTRRGEA